MDVFRIASLNGEWALLKAHGYKPLLTATNLAALLEHVETLTGGKGAVVRFESEHGPRELRIGTFDEQDPTALD